MRSKISIIILSVGMLTGCVVQQPPVANSTTGSQPSGPAAYLPTKESVPNINRYKARLLFEDALQKCSANFCGQNHWQDGHWWYKLIQAAPAQVTDSSFALVFTDEYTKEIKKYEFRYSKLNIYTMQYGPRKGSQLGFDVKKWEKLWILGTSYNDCKQLVDALYVLKFKNQSAEDQKELESFKPVAQQYKSLVVKPQLSEEARKYLVQATNATEEKRYKDGIDLLEKALAVDPTYPLAHFNKALLWSQVSAYGAAILEMKEYLMLVPDASDARASQDKIYEWEGKLTK